MSYNITANSLLHYGRQRVRAYLRRRDWAWHLSSRGIISKWRLEHFRDKHKGQRCFIMGNGPSLSQMDLSPLKDEFTFGLNRIYLMFDQLGFIPTYYAAVNALVIEQCAEDIARLSVPKFVSWRSRNDIRFTDDLIFLRTSYGGGYYPHFSKDPVNILWEGATVTYIALQLAYFMGFDTAVLIGVDHNFKTEGKPNTTVTSTGDDPDHFAADYFGKGFRWQLPDLEVSELAYNIARYEYTNDNRQILDATVNGKLTIFPKVEFSSLFPG